MKVIPQPLSVEEYHRLIKRGILNENDRCELLEGYLVPHIKRSPPHEYTRHALASYFWEMLPEEKWITRHRSGVALEDSEPEPDLALVRDRKRAYFERHPGPADFGIIIEIADVTLEFDRSTRGRIYAKSGLPVYWIANLVDKQIEVFKQPTSVGYSVEQVYGLEDAMPLELDGVLIGTIPCNEVLR